MERPTEDNCGGSVWMCHTEDNCWCISVLAENNCPGVVCAFRIKKVIPFSQETKNYIYLMWTLAWRRN